MLENLALKDWAGSTAILASWRALKSVSNQSAVFDSVVVGMRDDGGRNRDVSVESRTRPDAEGIGMEQEKVQSRVKRGRGYD